MAAERRKTCQRQASHVCINGEIPSRESDPSTFNRTNLTWKQAPQLIKFMIYLYIDITNGMG